MADNEKNVPFQEPEYQEKINNLQPDSVEEIPVEGGETLSNENIEAVDETNGVDVPAPTEDVDSVADESQEEEPAVAESVDEIHQQQNQRLRWVRGHLHR